MRWSPCLVRSAASPDSVQVVPGDPLVDDYLEFVAARCRLNTVLATGYDLKVFFEIVGKEPARVSTTDVFAFITAQRAPRRGVGVVRLEDGEAGLSARTIKRRLASVSGLFAYLMAREDVELRRNPVPRGAGDAAAVDVGDARRAAAAHSADVAAERLVNTIRRHNPNDRASPRPRAKRITYL